MWILWFHSSKGISFFFFKIREGSSRKDFLKMIFVDFLRIILNSRRFFEILEVSLLNSIEFWWIILNLKVLFNFLKVLCHNLINFLWNRIQFLWIILNSRSFFEILEDSFRKDFLKVLSNSLGFPGLNFFENLIKFAWIVLNLKVLLNFLKVLHPIFTDYIGFFEILEDSLKLYLLIWERMRCRERNNLTFDYFSNRKRENLEGNATMPNVTWWKKT